MSKYLIKGASLYGEKVADILIEDGVISRIAENIDAADAQVVEAARPRWRCRPGRHPHPPASARL